MIDYKNYNDWLFSRWAPIYDVFELFLSDVRKEMTRTINPAGKSILDIATGTGSLAIELSNTANKVVGIDLSSKMLEVAEKKRKNENLSFLLMDASKMEFKDGEFDAVTISLGLHDMPSEIRSKVVEEARRVLKEDGKLYILEYNAPKNSFESVLSRLINTFESKYYLDFLNSDFEHYLNTLGFKIGKQTNYLFNHLRFITLTK
jgi:ubiquinone/menaquinone biosynthesis C-methylase UbiE